jgi:hypothetical protein
MKTTRESADEQMLDEEEQAESGAPGGGKGRIDETGHSGVWPASGPWPEGDAPLVPPAGWGQGARGAAGYEDHGESELHILGVIGGEDEPPETKVTLIEAQAVPVHEWPEFLRKFTRRYAGEPVIIEVSTDEGAGELTRVLAEDLPLVGLDGEFREGAPVTVQVMVGEGPEVHATHAIVGPAYVWRYTDDTGKDVMLEIETIEGELTTVHL